MNEFLQSLTRMQKNVDSCENFLVHFRACDPRALHPTHNDPAWECQKEEAGGGCQQHSTARTLADPKNKSDAKTRGGAGGSGGEKGLLWDRVGRHVTGQGREGKGWTKREGMDEEVCFRKGVGAEEGGLEAGPHLSSHGLLGHGATRAPVLPQHCSQTSVTSHYC